MVVDKGGKVDKAHSERLRRDLRGEIERQKSMSSAKARDDGGDKIA
jgi:hypothetical protein